MPMYYYDSPSATKFSNFSNTSEGLTGAHHKPIDIIGSDGLGLNPDITKIIEVQHPAPNLLYLTGVYDDFGANDLFNAYVPSFYFNITSEFWDETETVSDFFTEQDIMPAIAVNIKICFNAFIGYR